MTTPTVRHAALAMLLLMAAPAAAEVQSKTQQACTLAMNKSFLKVAAAAGKVLAGCVKSVPGTIETCVAADGDGVIASADAKTLAAYDDRCVGSALPPPFGTTSVAAVGAAGRSMAPALLHALFGPDLDSGLVAATADAERAKCQRGVAKAVDKCATTILKELVKCKQAGLKAAVDPITDVTALAACLGADPKGAIAKQCDLARETSPGKLQVDAIRKTLDKCVAAGVDLAAALPACGAGDRDAAHACVDAAVTCRTCLAADQADGLGLDCDQRDDGAANGSCRAGPLVIGQHQCTLDPEISGASFDTTSFGTQLVLEGRLDFDCGTVDPVTNTAPCSCSIDEIAPVRVSGLGWACIHSFPGCAPGIIDCDGGSGLDQRIDSHHNIGTCTGNAQCASQCQALCGSAQVYESGCEGYCRGGSSAGLACSGDLFCPNGTCIGPDRVFNGHICECQCLTVGGTPSAPGSLRCNLGVRIEVEANQPCGDGDVILELGSQCLPFTTEDTAAYLTDANNVPGQELPPGGNTLYGFPVTCPGFAAGGPSAISMVTAVNFFEAPVARDSAFLEFEQQDEQRAD